MVGALLQQRASSAIPGDEPSDNAVQLARIRADRLKSWLTLAGIVVSTMIGTTAVGLTTAYINDKNEESKIRLEELKVEQSYLTEFAERALAPEFQSRIDFADFVASVATNSSYRTRWQQYRAKLEEEQTQSRADLIARNSELETLLAQTDEANHAQIQGLLIQIHTLESQLFSSAQRANSAAMALLLENINRFPIPEWKTQNCSNHYATVSYLGTDKMDIIDDDEGCKIVIDDSSEFRGKCQYHPVSIYASRSYEIDISIGFEEHVSDEYLLPCEISVQNTNLQHLKDLLNQHNIDNPIVPSTTDDRS